MLNTKTCLMICALVTYYWLLVQFTWKKINMLLAIFRFCRKLFVETIAYKLGFWSKKAIEFIVNCGKHHISWQICSIA